VRAWAERATGDDEVNRQVYARIIDPLRVPVVGTLLIAFVVLGLSRVLLAVPSKTASSVVFGLAALLFFGAVLVVNALPRLIRPLSIALLALGAVSILGGSVWAIVNGERPVHHDGGHPSEAPGEQHGPASIPSETEQQHGLGAGPGAVR
jgi:hypothetical protein